MKKNNAYALALVSAFLMWLAWPPMKFTTPLLLVGLVPLLIAISGINGSSSLKKGKQVFLTAGLAFLIWNTSCIYWVYNAVSSVNPVAAPVISLIPFGLGALLMTFAFWLYFKLSRIASNKIAYMGLISFYVAMEYLHQTWDLNFPWMTLGNGLAGMHQLAQWYEYTGVYGGTVWILLSNILAFETYKAFKSDLKGYAKWRIAFSWAVLIAVPAAISITRYVQYDEKPMPVNVVAVQPNIDPYEKFNSHSAFEQMNILIHLSDSIGQTNTEYFIWPETAIPTPTDEARIRESGSYLAARQFLSKYKNGTLVTGIESVKFTGDLGQNYNAAMQMENSANVQFYHKSKLVPGVEKMPFPQALSVLAPVFAGFGGTIGGWGWQDKPDVFHAYSGIAVTPVICYESLWGEWIGEAVKNGAQFIAIITNDGWWGNTSGKDQHLLYAKLRAIETRRSIARSANTGISAFINQRGDITQQTSWWTRTAIKADINLNDEITFYVKSGDLIAKTLCILALLLALVIPFNKYFRKDTYPQ
jgi:apolipoprotein N-acyltransferase